MDLVGLNRFNMDSSGPHKVGGDSGSRLNSPVSVEGGQASHAPSMNEQGQVAGGVVDILKQIAHALQRAVQPAAVTPQRLAIERMARYRPVDFMGRKDDEPSMADLCKCIARQKRNWNVRSHCFKMKLISGGFS